MGPFELMDLVGLDTNHAVAESFHRQTHGEPRYRPSQLQARQIAAGRLGRKSGHGWYPYGAGAPAREPDALPAAGGGDGRLVAVSGELPVARELVAAARAAGWDARPLSDCGGAAPWLSLDCAIEAVFARGPRARLLHAGSLHLTDPEAAGFHVVPPLAAARLVELTETPLTNPEATMRARELFASLGWAVEQVGDAPGLVLGRVVAQLVNEAAFLIGEGAATPEDVDAGMTLGVNHPRGPVAWAAAIGPRHVVTLLDALHAELGDPRYRVAPLPPARRARRRAGGGAGLSDADRRAVRTHRDLPPAAALLRGAGPAGAAPHAERLARLRRGERRPRAADQRPAGRRPADAIDQADPALPRRLAHDRLPRRDTGDARAAGTRARPDHASDRRPQPQPRGDLRLPGGGAAGRGPQQQPAGRDREAAGGEREQAAGGAAGEQRGGDQPPGQQRARQQRGGADGGERERGAVAPQPPLAGQQRDDHDADEHPVAGAGLQQRLAVEVAAACAQRGGGQRDGADAGEQQPL